MVLVSVSQLGILLSLELAVLVLVLVGAVAVAVAVAFAFASQLVSQLVVGVIGTATLSPQPCAAFPCSP